MLLKCDVQFLHNEGEERKALIPIIEKLLLLSPQEVKYLNDTLVNGMQHRVGALWVLVLVLQGKSLHYPWQNSMKTQTLPRTLVGLATSTDGQATDNVIGINFISCMLTIIIKYTGLEVQCAMWGICHFAPQSKESWYVYLYRMQLIHRERFDDHI